MKTKSDRLNITLHDYSTLHWYYLIQLPALMTIRICIGSDAVLAIISYQFQHSVAICCKDKVIFYV